VTNSPAKTKFKTSTRQVFKELEKKNKKKMSMRMGCAYLQMSNNNKTSMQIVVSERSARTAFQTISPICPYTLILSASLRTWAHSFFLKNFLSASKAFDRVLIFLNIRRNKYPVFDIRRG